MPYTSISEARIKKLDNVPLTLSQVNAIARMADSIGEDGWAIAISNFKKSHHITDSKWVANKEIYKYSDVLVQKEDDGRWKIIAISTVATKDLENETFTVEAIDYDARNAELSKDYPEFRMFHKKALAIGKVEKMRRIGIFAIDEGHSYEDSFSLHVCEKMLSNNDGKWKVSRGFYVIEASGGCPDCGTDLIIGNKHMVIGFRCPMCKTIHANKGVLKDVHFRKTKTFDVTVTDIPCVPFTGVSAFKKDVLYTMEVNMNKKELKQKLIEAGLDEEVVNDRLGNVTDEQLKEFTDIPFAQVLKEFEDSSDDIGDDEAVFVLDESSLKEFGDVVRSIVAEEVSAQLKESLNNLEVEVSDLDGFDINIKEIPQVIELVQVVKELSTKIDNLLSKDDERLKELLKEMPRSGKLRVRRFKSEDMDEEEEDEEDEEMLTPNQKKKLELSKQLVEGVLYDENGKIVKGGLSQHLFSGNS